MDIDSSTIEEAVKVFESNFHPLKIFYSVVLTALFFLFLFLYNKLIPSLNSLVSSLCKKYCFDIKYKELELLNQSVVSEIIKIIFKLLNLAIFIVIFYLYLMLSFSIFPATRGIANALLGYILSFLQFTYKSAVSFIPNVFSILLIVAITFLVLKFLRFFVWALRTQKVSFYGFHREWIYPTYNIVRFFTIVISIVMIAPYLPGFESPSFKAISVFLGVLVTLGSKSAVANVIAGVVLIYMRPFNLNDRVKIGEVVGDVVEMSLLVTRIKTIKNEYVTLPNSKVLGGSMVDYSSPAERKELIAHTCITIGYNTPVQTVKELLISSSSVEGVLEEPKPFVLVKELENSYIKYELNVYIESAKAMLKIYSDLHENIYDVFSKAGVEIMSAEYFALRDGNKPALPELK